MKCLHTHTRLLLSVLNAELANYLRHACANLIFIIEWNDLLLRSRRLRLHTGVCVCTGEELGDDMRDDRCYKKKD